MMKKPDTNLYQYSRHGGNSPVRVRAGTWNPFYCCGATYRSSKSKPTSLVNTKGILVVTAKVGEAGEVDGHIVDHVKTREGVITVSIRTHGNARRNLI